MNCKPEDSVLLNAEVGECPSCHKTMALPLAMRLDKLQTCPLCGACSYGYKWRVSNDTTRKKRV